MPVLFNQFLSFEKKLFQYRRHFKQFLRILNSRFISSATTTKCEHMYIWARNDKRRKRVNLMENVGGNVNSFIQILFRCFIYLWIRLDSYGMFAGVFIRGNNRGKFGQHASQHNLLTTRHVLISYQFTADPIIIRPIAVFADWPWLTYSIILILNDQQQTSFTHFLNLV